MNFALLVPPPEKVISAGIFMFAARLKELGQNFRFITHSMAADYDEVLCVSMVTDEPIKIVTRAKKIIAGGSGVMHNGLIESDKPTLYIKGAIDGIEISDLRHEGIIDKGLKVVRPLIPLIPKNFLYNTMSICVYSGTGCYHSKCIFCECCDNPFYEVEPGIVARTILECNRLYPGYDVRLSTDSPSNTFFDDLCTEMDKLLKQKYSAIKAEWCCYIRANQATNERMAVLSQAGCQSVAIGAEYFHDDVLRYIKKGITVEQILNAHSNAVNNGVIPGLTVIDFQVKDKEIRKAHEKILHSFEGWYVYASKWEDEPIPF